MERPRHHANIAIDNTTMMTLHRRFHAVRGNLHRRKLPYLSLGQAIREVRFGCLVSYTHYAGRKRPAELPVMLGLPHSNRNDL